MTCSIERIGDATLYLGDCRECIESVQADVTIGDPPYGVSAGWGSGLRKGGGKAASRAAKSAYQSSMFDDTPEYIAGVVIPAISSCIERFGRAAITPGHKHHRLYPAPAHTGSFQYPGSTVMSCWGPSLWQPILFYGRDPHQGRLVPDSRPNCNDVELYAAHPCPKPLKSWTWLVERASLPGEMVFDPFMGSGTTSVACAALGRKFIGVEIEAKYFDEACRRVERAYSQGDLFIRKPKLAVEQEPLFGDAA